MASERSKRVRGSALSFADVPTGAITPATDRTVGPRLGMSPLDITSGMESFPFAPSILPSPISTYPIPNSAVAGSSAPGQVAGSRVWYQIPASVDVSGAGVLSHAQGEFLFVLDGQSTMAKNDPVATSEVYNLASLNARLREAAEVENRIKFVGVQVDDTQTSEAKKSLYRKARAALVVCAGEGWCEVANCWGDVAEGTTVGFLLRKFTDPSGRSERRSGASSSSSAGSGSSALDVSPLQLVPVAIQTDTGWASHLNYGSPTVPMPFGSVPSSASEAHRKRQRSLVNLKMERLIDPRASSPSYSRREFVRASTILDCEQMEDRTTTGTIYGFRDKDRSRGPIIDPENISATYFDYDRTLVSRNLDGGKTARLNADSGEIVSGGTWAIYPTSCQGYFFPAGVVIRAARGGNPDVSKIHDCTFDELGFGLTKLRANNKITLQIRLDH